MSKLKSTIQEPKHEQYLVVHCGNGSLLSQNAGCEMGPTIEQMNFEKPTEGAISNEGLGRCWPWSHKYTVWKDTHTLTKNRVFDNTVVAFGAIQERRCQRCGKLQLRTVWA